jgi:hypothetical protein
MEERRKEDEGVVWETMGKEKWGTQETQKAGKQR